MVLLRILWNDLWPLARGLGDHGAQLADILATYAPRLFNSAEMLSVCEAELEAIKLIANRHEFADLILLSWTLGHIDITLVLYQLPEGMIPLEFVFSTCSKRHCNVISYLPQYSDM